MSSFDEPSYVLASQAVADAGVGDRVAVRHDDANRLDDVDAYDVVTMSITLHETGGPDEYRSVLARVHRASSPAGHSWSPSCRIWTRRRRTEPSAPTRMLAGVQLHEALVGCGAITQAELLEPLHATGFKGVRVADQSLPTRFMMLADKAASLVSCRPRWVPWRSDGPRV